MAAAEAKDAGNKRAYLKKSLQCAKALRQDELRHTSAWAALIEAGVHFQKAKEKPEALLRRLDAAISQLEAAKSRADVAAARRQKGLILGGDEGAQLVREADAWFTSEGVKNPARFSHMLAPGFTGRNL